MNDSYPALGAVASLAGDCAFPSMRGWAETDACEEQTILTPKADLILRFRRAEITIHWAVAVPFMVCYLTGFVIKLFFNLHSDSGTRLLLSWLHRVGGVSLIVLPIVSAIRHRDDFRIHLYNIKQVLTWTVADVKWLLLMGAAALSKRITLPEQHKFNAAEKLNFMMVMGTYPFFAVTGLLLLTPGVHFLTFVAHVGMALLVTPLLVGHIYMAVVNPSTRVGLKGMVSGHVDREWASHHYRRWYRELFEDDEKAAPAAAAEPRTVPILALVRCCSCVAEHLVDAQVSVTGRDVEVRAGVCPPCGSAAELVSVVVEEGRTDPVLTALAQAGVRLVPAGTPPEAEPSEAPFEAVVPDDDTPRRASNA